MFFTATIVTFQRVALSVLGILSSAMALATSVAAMAFAIPVEVSHSVIMSPKATFALALTVPFHELDISPEAANRLACESSPCSSGTTIHQKDMLGGLGLCHIADA